ncbi:hypothetical protein [Streptomyces sp. NEAU-NA10]|uniref:hypothetical protein n=1 Tax=Streptomyces sp. NEAU-NA10 TaxID=3416050 RepID=UPI003CC611A2
MAATPDRIVVRVDVRGADEAFKQMVRQMVRARPPLPPRRHPRWRRIARWRKGRR